MVTGKSNCLLSKMQLANEGLLVECIDAQTLIFSIDDAIIRSYPKTVSSTLFGGWYGSVSEEGPGKLG